VTAGTTPVEERPPGALPGGGRLLLPDGVPAGRRDALLAAAAGHRLGLVGDLDHLEERYGTATAAAAEHGIELLCAVKASTHPEVLGLAAAYGLGFDVANAVELAHVPAGAGTVSLTSPALPAAEKDELFAAFRAGRVTRWHADSLAQLAELCDRCPGTTVGVRVNLDGLDVPAGLPLWQPSRFGIPLTDLGRARAVAEARGCRLRWLHTHNASEVNDTASFAFAAREIVRAAAAHGVDLEVLDLGGGVLGPPGSLGELFGAVRAAAGPGVGVVLEPGRWWLTDCITLVTQVLEVKHLGPRSYLVLDMGTMNHLQWADYLRQPVLAPAGAWRVCGRSCFEEDWLDEEEPVPVRDGGYEPRAGDYYALGNVSGYAVELATAFNGLAPATLTFVRPGR
jgi:diaminopimelate decarboxylase